MADQVQKRLEDFVPDLHDLLSHGLCTQHEIKKIVENRRKFEFEILSSDPNISLLSYKDYLKFEMEFDNMIQSRLKNFKRNKFNNRIYNLKNFNNEQSNKLNDKNNNLNVRNNSNKLKLYKLKINNKRYIHNIFRRCLNRFVNNVEMYKMYLSYCTKIKANKLFERVIIDGLSKNPNDDSMWLILGSFLLNNKGLTRSKNVVQRALRILPDSLELILYLFKLEIKSLLLVYNNYSSKSDNSDTSNSVSISNGDGANDEVFDTLNRCLVIFKYGLNNLKKQSDLIVFYFSVLNILCKLRNKMLDHDNCNITSNNSENINKEINKLLDSVNSLIKDKNIPIITLYNYQIQLMELILTKPSDDYVNFIETKLICIINNRDIDTNDSENKEKEKENDLKQENYDNKENNKEDILVLYLQFLYNILSNKLQLDINKDNSEEIVNRCLSNLEREYIVGKYCILENVYYLCLLGKASESLNRCKNTSYLISVKHLNYLYNLFKNYYNDFVDKNQLVDFILKIKVGNDTYNIYFYLKLLVLLSNIININDSNIIIRDNINNINNNKDNNNSNMEEDNNSNNNRNNNIEDKINNNKLILDKIKEISIQLSQIKNIDNDELIYLILKLNIDFNLKLKIIKNFSKISKFNMNYLFDCELSESEIIELFLILVKLDNSCDFDVFFDKFIGNYNTNLNSLLDKLMVNNNINSLLNNLFFNNFIKYILIRIDNHLNHLNCLYTINNMDDFSNSLNNIIDLSKLNKLIKINTLDISNKTLMDNLNTKLSLFGLNIYRN